MIAYIDCIILASNISHWPNDSIDRRMEAVVILRSQTEYTQSASNVFRCLAAISFSQELLNCEIPSLYPKFGSFSDRLECHHPAVSTADKGAGIIKIGDRPSTVFELAIEKLVKCFCTKPFKCESILNA